MIFRRAVLHCFPFLLPPSFNGGLAFDAELSAIDWGDQDASGNWRYGIARVDARDGSAVTLSFWNDVTPVVQPSEAQRTALDGSHCDAPDGEMFVEPRTAAVAALVERVGGRRKSLASLDSLQAISLAELVRRELGASVSVGDVLRSRDAAQLAACLTALPHADRAAPHAAEGDIYRLYMMRFTQAEVDWCVRYGGPGHLDVVALQRAVDRLVARHSALRTTQSPDEPMRVAMDSAAAMWQLATSCIGQEGALWSALSQAVSTALLACWPRTLLCAATAARVVVGVPEWPCVLDETWELSEEEYFFWTIRDMRKVKRWPFDIYVVPVCHSAGSRLAALDLETASVVEAAAALPPEDVTWYIYAAVTHAYSDGAAGRALYSDLLQLYAAEAGLVEAGAGAAAAPPPPPEHLALLQRRLTCSLRGRLPRAAPDANGDVYHEAACEDWGKRPGFQRQIDLMPDVTVALRAAAVDVLGCGVDVAWITAILGTLFRLFPSEPCFYLLLKCGCRDGPGEEGMVGYLSEQRVIAVDVGDPSQAALLDVARLVDAARRSRSWRAPVPYEAGLCVYVNIVSSMLSTLPLGCRQVTRAARGGTTPWTDAYNHVNIRLDQRTENDWDFRFFHWDAAWGWEWSTCFAQALGSVIADMATSPTAALLRAPSPRTAAVVAGADVAEVEEQEVVGASGQRKRNAQQAQHVQPGSPLALESEAEEPPSKAARPKAAR